MFFNLSGKSTIRSRSGAKRRVLSQTVDCEQLVRSIRDANAHGFAARAIAIYERHMLSLEY